MRSWWVPMVVVLAANGSAQEPGAAPSPQAVSVEALGERLEREGVTVDLAHREVRIRGTILRDRPSQEYPIEFLLVNEEGKSHETLGVVRCTPSLLNACLLWLGLEPGQCRRVVLKDPLPPEDDIRLGIEDPFTVIPPRGDRVFCYVRWIDPDGSERIVPVEDLLMDVRSGESLPIRGYVYVGSRFAVHQFGSERREVYIADYEGNIAAVYPDRSPGENAIFDLYVTDSWPYQYVDVNPRTCPPTGTVVEFLWTPVHREGTRPFQEETLPEPAPLPEAAELQAAARNPFLKEASADLVARIGARDLQELLGMLRRGTPALKEVVVGLLGVAGHPDALPALEETLLYERDDEVRLSAAYALAEIATPAALDVLLAALHTEWWKAREDALFALQLLSGEDHGFDTEAWRRWSERFREGG